MGDLLLVDFASRSKAYTKQPEQTLETMEQLARGHFYHKMVAISNRLKQQQPDMPPTCHDELTGNSVLEAMAALEGIPYVAPESNSA